MDILDIIEAERSRQISVEGWTPAHDDEHDGRELLRAARCYFEHATAGSGERVPAGWPWDPQWWKPKDARRDLVRAGALCLAERDRSHRAGEDAWEAAKLLESVVKALEATP